MHVYYIDHRIDIVVLKPPLRLLRYASCFRFILLTFYLNSVNCLLSSPISR